MLLLVLNSNELIDEFDPEFAALSEAVQDEMLGHAKLLEQFGPQLGRPRVDTVKNTTRGICALLSLLTRSARLSFSSRVISQAAAKSVFIGSS